MHTANSFQGKRVTVMGLGRFGGGAGVTRWLASQGAHVLLTDMQSASELQESIAGIQDLIDQRKVTLHLDGHDAADFSPLRCDLVIANPAVPKPWSNPYITAAINSGVCVTTEIRLLIEQIPRNRAIAVTGSAGKSTTTAMIHHILRKAAPPNTRAHLGGNIGGSLLNHLDEIQPNDWIVLELSSAMLYWLSDARDAQGWSPHIAVLTNISPNHIDWHGSFEHYKDSKLNIFRYQKPGDHKTTAPTIADIESLQRIGLSIPGIHNQINAHAAIAAAMLCARSDPSFPIDAQTAATLLNDFAGLPHRLQLVAQHDGMRFYNDSKSTTPEATLLAVDAFDDPAAIHLIAGGYDKGSDLTPIAKLASTIAGLYTIGTTGPTLAHTAQQITASNIPGTAVFSCETLARAVNTAMSRMKPNDILLLSPGCASWDQFTNYEQRGEAFTAMVNASNAHATAATCKA